MNKMQLKNTILQHLARINDTESLKKILDLVNELMDEKNEAQESYPFLGNESDELMENKENFNEYIKEWIKQM